MDLKWIRDAWKMENKWILVENYRFQNGKSHFKMENPILKWDFPFEIDDFRPESIYFPFSRHPGSIPNPFVFPFSTCKQFHQIKGS